MKLRFKAIFIDEVQIFDPQYLELCYLGFLEDAEDNVFLMARRFESRLSARRVTGRCSMEKDCRSAVDLLVEFT